MGLRQAFHFKSTSPEVVRSFLRSLTSVASLDERAPEFFVFTQNVGEPEFTFDCELTSQGIISERAGEYFSFLGRFVEALTGHFGAVAIEDA
jgi:hypothetical protein